MGLRLFLVLLALVWGEKAINIHDQNILAKLSDLELRIDAVNFKGDVKKIIKNLLPEGTVWNHQDAITAESSNARISLSFLNPVKINFLAIQADANDSYMIFCENDRSSHLLYAAPPVLGRDGLWIREAELKKTAECTRLLVRPTMGDTKYSLSWLFVSEQKPQNWDQFKNSVPKNVNYLGLTFWSVPRINALRLGLIFTTLVCVSLLSGYLKKAGLIICLVLGFIAWHNAGRFHLTRYFHAHDVFHYYVGSKYSPELGYRLIYRCTLRALEELDIKLPSSTRNLDTNLVVSSKAELAKSGECEKNFKPARWESFVKDINFFTKYHGNFSSIILDHGYNASPVWNIFGYFISNLLPATDLSLTVISFLDSFLVGLALLFAIRAFGLEPTAILTVVWGTAQHADYGWTGNAYLRLDWLALGLIGISLVKLQRLGFGFFFLFLAAGLRIFPGLSLLGISLAWVMNRSFDFRRFIHAGFVFMALFFVAELYIFRGFGHSVEFLRNLLKHSQTFSTNVVGTRIIASYSDQSRVSVVKDLNSSDGFALWKKQRQKVLEERKLFHIMLNLTLIALYVTVVKLGAPLDAVALSALLLTQCISSSNYDYVFMALMAVLPSGFLGAATALYFAGLTHVVAQYYEGMPFDDIYFGQSVLIYLWSIFLLLSFIVSSWRSDGRSLIIYNLLRGDRLNKSS
ncbi:MAG: hypothetical protein QXL01_07320 [Thermoplasmatales archaeon]